MEDSPSTDPEMPALVPVGAPGAESASPAAAAAAAVSYGQRATDLAQILDGLPKLAACEALERKRPRSCLEDVLEEIEVSKKASERAAASQQERPELGCTETRHDILSKG